MTSNNTVQSESYPTKDPSSSLSSGNHEDNDVMSLENQDKVKEESGNSSSSNNDHIPQIGIEPSAIESIVHRILVEADQPLGIEEIIEALSHELVGIKFTREHLIPILTSSSIIKTFTPFALFTFVPSKNQGNAKSKKKIQRSKSNLNSTWNKWVMKDTVSTNASTKFKKGQTENEVHSQENQSNDEVREEGIKIRELDPQKKYRGRPVVTTNKPLEETDKHLEEVIEVESFTVTDNKAVENEEVIISNSEQSISSESSKDNLLAEAKLSKEEILISNDKADNSLELVTDNKTSELSHSIEQTIDNIKVTVHVTENDGVEKESTLTQETKENNNITQELLTPIPKTKATKAKKAKGKKAENDEAPTTDTVNEPQKTETKKRKKTKETKSSEKGKQTEYNLFAEFENSDASSLSEGLDNKDEEITTNSSIPTSTRSDSTDKEVLDKVTEDSIEVITSSTSTTDMNQTHNTEEKMNNAFKASNNTPDTQSEAQSEEDNEDILTEGEEICRYVDENTGNTIIVNLVDPSTLSEEEREWLEKYEHDRLNKTPDQIDRERARAARRKAMGEGTTAFVTSLKTRGSRKTVAIDKKSWGSLFDE